MAYREDLHLEFFQTLDNNELEVLVEMFLKDGNNDLRFTEPYKNYFEKKKKEAINHKEYWKYIAEEYQLFGGNTFINYIFRWGKGVVYQEILENVISKLNIKCNKDSVDKMEKALLEKVLENSLEKMTEEQRKELVESLDLKTTNFTKQAVTVALQVAIKQGGFISYQIAVIVANTIAKSMLGRGLSLAANAALTKYLSVFAGPVGWAISGLWTVADISGPAYRVTIPATIYIAALRQSKLKENLFEEFICPNCNRSFSLSEGLEKCPYCGESI